MFEFELEDWEHSSNRQANHYSSVYAHSLSLSKAVYNILWTSIPCRQRSRWLILSLLLFLLINLINCLLADNGPIWLKLLWFGVHFLSSVLDCRLCWHVVALTSTRMSQKSHHGGHSRPFKCKTLFQKNTFDYFVPQLFSFPFWCTWLLTLLNHFIIIITFISKRKLPLQVKP